MRNRLSPSAFLRVLLPFVCVLALAMPQVADARQMDPKAVAGIPLPVPDVAVGTVVVRVIKGTRLPTTFPISRWSCWEPAPRAR